MLYCIVLYCIVLYCIVLYCKGNAHHLGLKRTQNGSTKLNMQ